jgi:hypothetical protein
MLTFSSFKLTLVGMAMAMFISQFQQGLCVVAKPDANDVLKALEMKKAQAIEDMKILASCKKYGKKGLEEMNKRIKSILGEHKDLTKILENRNKFSKHFWALNSEFNDAKNVLKEGSKGYEEKEEYKANKNHAKEFIKQNKVFVEYLQIMDYLIQLINYLNL